MNHDFVAITKGITVAVRPVYLEQQSRPQENHYLWAYRVRIENNGLVTVQLLKRTWHITDERGQVQHVHGEGVVGEQPVIQPGMAFEYSSGTPLRTPTGLMMGQYHMIETGSGENFDIEIPAFSLDSPHYHASLH